MAITIVVKSKRLRGPFWTCFHGFTCMRQSYLGASARMKTHSFPCSRLDSTEVVSDYCYSKRRLRGSSGDCLDWKVS